MPGFPDAFAPFYKAPPGKTLSGGASRVVGSFIRPLRRISQRKSNLTPRWSQQGSVPSGWGHVVSPGPLMRAAHYFYQKLQYSGEFQPASARQQALQADGHQFIGEAKRRIEQQDEVAS
jgi:hydrogenase small subunit